MLPSSQEKHDIIQKVGLNYFRQLLLSCEGIYHYTTANRLKSIQENGLVVKSPRTTLNNVSRGIYFTTDDSMNYKETMNDVHEPFMDEDVYRLEIDLSRVGIQFAFIDTEFHTSCDSEEDFILDIEELDEMLFGYIVVDIHPDFILSYVKMDKTNMKRNGTFLS